MNKNIKDITDPKITELLDGIDFSNAKPWKDVLNEWDFERANRKWYEKVWDKIYFKILYPLKPRELQWKWTQLKCFFLRGKYGWSYMDTWGYDRYLAGVISGGVKEIHRVHHGHPCGCTDEQWTDILAKIAFTFELAEKIHDENLVFLDREDFESEESYLEQKEHYKKLAQENPDVWKMISDEDMEKYREGWRLFERYFFNLWD